MLRKMIDLLFGSTLLLAVGVSPAHAHHVMDYALPATVLDGLLSGLGHPVIGIDHLLFIVGAERAPLAAYLVGLAAILCAIELGAWRGAVWAAVRYPKLPIRQLAGAAAGIAGLVFSGMAIVG